MTWTPETNATRNDLLTAEQLGQIQGAKHGWLMWVGDDRAWTDILNPLWRPATTMRAKPKPKRDLHPEYLRAIADVEAELNRLRPRTGLFAPSDLHAKDLALLQALAAIVSLREVK